MARVGNADVKLLFNAYSGLPGPEARDFKKSCIQKLGQPDKFGCSIADCLLRTDMGAVMRGTDVYVAGVFVPGVPSPRDAMPWPVGGMRIQSLCSEGAWRFHAQHGT